MYVKEITINNQVGLHARPATFFIQKANEFKCSIWVEKEERRVNGKSLLGVLSLGIVKGTTVSLISLVGRPPERSGGRFLHPGEIFLARGGEKRRHDHAPAGGTDRWTEGGGGDEKADRTAAGAGPDHRLRGRPGRVRWGRA